MSSIPLTQPAAHISWDELFSGFVGSVVGVLAGAVLLYWQTREVARHELKAMLFIIWNHVMECRSHNNSDCFIDPWSIREYKDQTIAAFYRYRALSGPLKRKKLDLAWQSFSGTQKGEYPSRAAQFKPSNDDTKRRIQGMLAAV